MIVNILKHTNWINELANYNDLLFQINAKYIPINKKHWFNPSKCRLAPLSRLYPNLDPVINFREEYKLLFYIPNYLPLFLIKTLYSIRKNIVIEDVGTGNGNLLYYLSKLGFKKFSTFDNFSECPRELFEEVITAANVNCAINELNVNPTVVHNASAPRFCYITPGLDINGVLQTEDYTYYKVNRTLTNLELICFYSNTHWES